MASPIVGLILFWTLVFIALLVVNIRTKAPITIERQEVLRANRAPSSVTSFRDSLDNKWELTNVSGVLQYIWTAPGQDPLVLWDSTNLGCGPNQTNYLLYQAAFPLGPSYLREDSISLGMTPETTNASGDVVSFRLVLYQGDVRIESLTDSGFWSIFPQTTQSPLSSWPSSGTAVVWQSLNLSTNLAAQFLASGDLVLKLVDQVGNYWAASTLQVPAPCV
jgi:hypothetical protein